jgi:hypothetical protein
VTLVDEAGQAARGLHSTVSITETLRLEGLAGDERWLGGVQVCDMLEGYESCQEAEMLFFSDVLTDTVGRTVLADEAAWSVERFVELGIDGATVPVTVTAYDAAGNGAQLSFDLLIDTLAPTVTLSAPPVTQIDYDGAFGVSGNVEDRSGVSFMALAVSDPLGETNSYAIHLETEGEVSSSWQYELSLGTDEFAMPGDYTYVILAYDELGNEREVGPFSLTVGAPAQILLNAPFFVSASNDLWEGFAPGAPVYMRVEFDDADLPLGDVITVTVDPFPAWLTLNRLDERTLEISGTVPLTITQITLPDDAPIEESEEITGTAPLLLQINLGMTLIDSTGRQAYQDWIYEQMLTGPTQLYLPAILRTIADPETPTGNEVIYLPTVHRYSGTED